MTLHVALTHRTRYRYDRPVSLGPQTIRLRPAPHARTPIVSYALRIEPKPHFINWMQDPSGNYQARIVFPERVTHFDVAVDLVADMATINPFDFFLEPEAEHWPFAYDPVLAGELAPYRVRETPGPLLQALLDGLDRTEQRTVDMLVALNQQIQHRIAYVVRMEPGVWTPEETLARGQGSCRDSAWLLVQILRHLGFAARFVSGYLIQLVADQKPVTGPEGPTEDFTDLHAWAEIYLPGAGWVGLDATSGLLTGEGHIPLAATPEPASAAAISGLVEPCETEFDFSMAVTRVLETPRTTRPYDDTQWQAILEAGRAVDAMLAAGHVGLTMGGEPTFIAAADMDAPEWNIDALGPTKRAYAGRLLRRLLPLWSKGAAIQHVLGKHYPGEQLPRWALLCHWRRDGEPVWTDPELLASDDDTDTATERDAAAFCAALAERLQVDPDLVSPAYEDIHYYLWREHRLPANVVVEDAKLRDPLERERLARVYGHGLNVPVGSVLPLRVVVRDGVRRWQSGRWFFRGDLMFLVPGDAPLGFRLPLQSLLWASDASIDHDVERDPFAPVAPLPPHPALARRTGPALDGIAPEWTRQGVPGRDHGSIPGGAAGEGPALSDLPALPPYPGGGLGRMSLDRAMADHLVAVGQEEPELVRTALAVEARGGILHVFFPPLYAAEDWLDLCAAVEDTARAFGRKVVLEGYQPPRDSGLLNFSITPDPGVIEVNIHPAASWDEHVTRSDQLYDQARQVGLIAEKFMVDGRHVGTGGGNHVVMGAARAADSPFLRRPDLLKSLLGFWHNHPSLSYLFSGLFIGPSSQHPRVDEARDDSIAELEIAFAQVRPGQHTPPWLTDRLFRNLLADITGNTHRTEFCIDKLYAPESASGRLGLVEYRAFEMPPHPQMAAAQMLLMRAAVAAFWNRPYDRRLVRWGTRLHDDFMLPYYVRQDFEDAIAELRTLGAPLDPAWFAPHLAFRFPEIGAISLLGMTVELRHALEPWHTLAEEPGSGGTVRYVDSSAERVQVQVTGWVDERYVLACNGVGVPLTRTERQGEYVGGVRFKAWNPPSALHPTVGVQSPLVFDVYDSWTGRSLGGLTYHVAHPGGRNYETRPVNANEAEARRRTRFFPFGHTVGAMAAPALRRSLEQPRTLDLRRFP
ncbi:transglutaminase family protein [Gluconacetobacter diazotrophicus]|uniref:Transglutaminase family protein n=2 Tax=Gluconacetobacter diazotrophicus TaxID=33996 RepID=A0A7W4NH24_GLUDI|nr:transglutaminase family protein [Gluconacetobacter diazotrophicus]MBB2157649.1 transglutaminase family protein [Gluconacetobacter diazotrophicus]CAP54119.1 putative transglutaminase-like protein [Gluconacetobacter diazotrophicus PA1 5]